MNYQNALNRYKNTQVNTADGGTLVVMLYESVLRSIDIAIKKMNYKNYDLVNDQIKKSADIINELMASLDMNAGVISDRLKSIYLYILEKLNQSNINKSTEELKEVKVLLKELLSAWRSVANGELSVNEKPLNQKMPPKDKKSPSSISTGRISISG